MKLLLWAFFLSIILVHGQNYNLSLSKNYGGTNQDICNSICTDSVLGHKGFTLTGNTSSFDIDVSGRHDSVPAGIFSSDIWVINIDSNSSIVWQKCFGGTNIDLGINATQIADGGYIVIGNTNSSNGDVHQFHFGNCGGNNCMDGLIIRLNQYGDTVWTKTVGGSRDDRLTNVEILGPNRMLITGYTGSNDGDVSNNHDTIFTTSGDGYDAWAIYMDLSGNIIWNKCYGSTGTIDLFNSSCKINANEIYLVGLSAGINGDVIGNHGNRADAWIVKIDTLGTILQTKCFGGPSDDGGAFSMIKISDNHFAFIANYGYGYSGASDVINNPDTFSPSIWLVQIDSSANIIHQNQYWGTGYDIPKSITKINDNKFVIAAYTSSEDYDVTNLRGWIDNWIIIVDSTGSILFQSCYGTSGNDQPGGVVVVDDGIYIGGTVGYPDFDITTVYGYNDFWFYKLESITNIDDVHDFKDFKIFPNPTTREFIYSFYSANESKSRLQITNLQGRILYSESVLTSSGYNDINIQYPLAPGLYIIQLNTGKTIYMDKLIVID